MSVVMPAAGEPETLELRHGEVRGPHEGEAVVRVEATGVSFAEQQMRRGRYFDQPAFPFVPGYDLIGTVVAVDAPGSGVAEGQRVAALTKVGAWADHVVLPATDLVLVPANVDPAAAEAVIVNGLTAWRMLHRVARAREGDTVVVLGANGGVGSTLVQLARLAGVAAIGTASAEKLDAVRRLGARAVDYRSGSVVERVRSIAPGGVAAVFDHVAGEGLRQSWEMLAPGGTLVAYGVAAYRDATGDPMAPVMEAMQILSELQRRDADGRRWQFFNVWEGYDEDRERFRAALRTDLSGVFGLVAAGKLKPVIAARFPLQRAGEALRFAEGGVVGKVILEP
jgi:NADPH:quinone reductase-like Zn-dependent oxidoreductase